MADDNGRLDFLGMPIIAMADWKKLGLVGLVNSAQKDHRLNEIFAINWLWQVHLKASA